MENLLKKLEKENKELKETKASQMKGIRLIGRTQKPVKK